MSMEVEITDSVVQTEAVPLAALCTLGVSAAPPGIRCSRCAPNLLHPGLSPLLPSGSPGTPGFLPPSAAGLSLYPSFVSVSVGICFILLLSSLILSSAVSSLLLNLPTAPLLIAFYHVCNFHLKIFQVLCKKKKSILPFIHLNT